MERELNGRSTCFAPHESLAPPGESSELGVAPKHHWVGSPKQIGTWAFRKLILSSSIYWLDPPDIIPLCCLSLSLSFLIYSTQTWCQTQQTMSCQGPTQGLLCMLSICTTYHLNYLPGSFLSPCLFPSLSVSHSPFFPSSPLPTPVSLLLSLFLSLLSSMG